jgi:hypothetical protein
VLDEVYAISDLPQLGGAGFVRCLIGALAARCTSVREAGPEVREAGGKGGKEATTAAQARRALVSTLL